MISTAYSEAAAEVLEILENTDKEAVNKIPKKFMNFLKENSSKTYKPNFDKKKTIKELNLKPKTKALLGLIYLKCWANEEQKSEFKEKIQQNENKYQQELSQKYNSDNLFKSKSMTKQEDTTKQTSLIEIKKETFIQKIINKIKSIFRR